MKKNRMFFKAMIPTLAALGAFDTERKIEAPEHFSFPKQEEKYNPKRRRGHKLNSRDYMFNTKEGK